MDRKEFIILMGAATGGALLVSCFDGCKKDDSSSAAHQNVDFTLDLTASSSAALKTNGGFLVTQGVIVARTLSGTYIAVASACTHQSVTIGYQSSSNQFRCPSHGSVFSATGAVVNGPAATALQQFNTALSGNNLRVFSS
jgi:cytochrome b6-f complex iron-sulfur subunit